MANAFSLPQSMGQYIQPVNLNLVNAALSSKQQKYDYNVAKIDSLLSEFSSIELIRDEDKKYLADRVNGVLNTVNQAGKLDMASNNLTREITQYIGTAIDENVLTQASNSIRLKTFEQSVAERREKKPDTYSDINYTYAKESAGLQDYLRGEDANGKKVDSFGSLQYSEYKDVNKRINDFTLDLLSKSKDSVIKIPERDANGNPTGYMIEKTIRGLSPEQLRTVAESQLDASYMQQVKINGWYNSGGYKDTATLNTNLDEISTNYVSNIEANILKLKRDKDNGVADADVDTDIQQLENSKASIKKNIDFYKKSPEAAATFIEKEKVLSGAVQTFQNFYAEDISYSADTAYFQQQNLTLSQAKFKYQVEKDNQATQAGGVGEAFTTVVPTDSPDDPESYQKSIDNQISEASAITNIVRDNYVLALENEVSKGNKEASNFLAEYDKLKSNKKKGETDEDVFDNLIASTTYKDKLNILGDTNFRYNLKEAQDKERLLLNGLQEAEKKGIAAQVDSTVNSKEGLKAFYDNPDTKMLWEGSKGNTKAFSVRDVLIKNKIIDEKGNKIGDLKSKPTLLKALQQSYYADDVISNASSDYGYSDKSLKSLRSLAISLGENPKDVIIQTETDLGNRGLIKINQVNNNSKTSKYLHEAGKNGLYDTWSWNDQSLSSDDGTIGKFLRSDHTNTLVYKNEIKKYYNNLPSTQQLSIPSTDKANFSRLRGYMGITNAGVGKDSPITISKQGQNIVLTQAHSEGSGDKKSTAPIQVKLTQQEFNQNFGALSSKVNFNNEAAFYTTDKMMGKKLISEPIRYFSKADYKTASHVKNVILNNEVSRAVFGGYLTEEDTYKNLYSSHLTMRQKGGAQFDNILKGALNKDVASKFSVNMLVDRDYSGEPILQVNLVSKTGENIHSEVIRGNENITNFKGVLDTAPQAYYGMMLSSIFSEQEELINTGSSAPSESLNKLSKYIP